MSLRSRHRILGGAAFIAVASLLAYSPALRGQFIWDDDTLLTQNRLVHASNGLPRIWFTTEPFDYWPMTNSSFWLEWRLWGMNSTGYHATNLLLHIAAALLIWAILRKLAIPGAFLAALLFAVHPVNVESVAWIAQRKNTLAMFFFLLSILWYLREEEERDEAEKEKRGKGEETSGFGLGLNLWYWLSLLAFLLAMLSKGSVAILPLELLLIVWWLRQRITFADVARTAPFFLIAMILAWVNIWFQTHGEEIVVRDANWIERLIGAGGVTWFYLSKALLPIDLIFVYHPWQIHAQQLLWWLPLLAAGAMTVVLWRQHNSPTALWSRSLLFAWGFFCVALIPVMGFTDVYFMKYSLVADHYQYHALIAVVAVAGACWSQWHHRARGYFRAPTIVIAAVVVGAFMLQSMQQCNTYKSLFALWETTMQKNSECWLAHNNLGNLLIDGGQPQEAIDHFQQALRAKPNYPDAHSNMGNALHMMHRPQEAIEQYQEALRLNPDFAMADFNLANVLAEAGRSDEAIEKYLQALRIKPKYTAAQFNLGCLLFKIGRSEEGIEHVQQALRLKPDFAEAYNFLGNALLTKGRTQEAIDQFQQALLINPDFAEVHNNLGRALEQIGWSQAAIEQYQQAVQLKPDYTDAYNNLGGALLNSGQDQQAINCYEQALRLQSDYHEAHYNLGMALFKIGRPEQAVAQFQQTLQLKPDYAAAYLGIAMAYVQMNRTQEAIAAAEKGLTLAQATKQKELTEKIKAWLIKYRAD